ncbi:MAG: aminopeptidase P family protein [Lactobacillaceae bacterium]|jgi:Xaa-Pro aminopeptidase|nr:aminopeptidase P family protein [Lactobacillaceae bacterium]
MTERLNKVRAIFDKLDIDGILVADGANMKYLTGFYGGTGDGLVLVGKDGAALITDNRYEEDMRNRIADDVQLLITRDYWAVAMVAAQRFKIAKLGFEDSLPYRDFDYIDENFVGEDIAPTPGLLEALREVKDEAELAALRKAGEVAVAGFNELLEQLHAGMTEREVANLLDYIMKQKGADKPSFDTIVAAGINGALPHAQATDKVIEKGELVTIDFGYFVDDYTSDVTRTIAFGEVSEELQNIYGIVKHANEVALAGIHAEMDASKIDDLARDVINEAGYGKNYEHSTGHGVGLAIHEGPAVSGRSEDTIHAGMLLTIEPGIYLPGIGGVRIEDDVITTKDGIENLTAGISKELIVIDK